VSQYLNDPRILAQPIQNRWWLVQGCGAKFLVIRGDDDIHRAFHCYDGTEPDDQLRDAPEGDFDTVVHALIGDPR
jgi:hypothetical protein